MKQFNSKLYKPEKELLQLPVQNSRIKFSIGKDKEEELKYLISHIWEDQSTEEVYKALLVLFNKAYKRKPQKLIELDEVDDESNSWSEEQFYLICFGDHIKERNGQASGNRSSLKVLHDLVKEFFPKEEFKGLTVHLLPHFTSPGIDRGFDVENPFEVQRTMGNWEDVEDMSKDYSLMFDFVLNHLSIKNRWYQETLKDNPKYEDFFISFDEKNPSHMKLFKEIREKHQKKIYRPRAHDVFVKVKKADGSYTWTFMHFSLAQPDVNYHNPMLFMKMIEIFFYYIIKGARTVRLDAIPYIWKEWGTASVHHEKAHLLVRLYRIISDLFSPSFRLLTESMEPPQDSSRYLTSDKEKKAHMGYNFLPCGLIPYTLINKDASKFEKALKFFETDNENTTQAVVCGKTHDGTSVNATRAPKSVKGKAVLSEKEISQIANFYTKQGKEELKKRSKLNSNNRYYISSDFEKKFKDKHKEGLRFVNYKTVSDAKGNQGKIIYEVISTYASIFDKNPDKIVAGLAMAFPLKGIPFIYLTALFAALNDYDYYFKTGGPRQLNEGRLLIEEIKKDMGNKKSLTYQVFSKMRHLIKIRTQEKAFHPKSDMKSIVHKNKNKSVFAVLRISQDKKEKILSLQNVSDKEQTMNLTGENFKDSRNKMLIDLVANTEYNFEGSKPLKISLKPYQIVWLKEK